MNTNARAHLVNLLRLMEAKNVSNGSFREKRHKLFMLNVHFYMCYGLKDDGSASTFM
jgi:hypothetical protein